jgi:hypothetical protein
MNIIEIVRCFSFFNFVTVMRINGDNSNNIRPEASRHFRNKKGKYQKGKINELATQSKNNNIKDLHRRINKFKKVYQPRSNTVQDEDGDLLADSHNILNMWKNYFSRLLNVHRANDVRHIEVDTDKPLIPNNSLSEFEIAVAKLKRYKSPRSVQIRAELNQSGSETLRAEVHKLINSIWIRKSCLISGRSLLFYQFTRRVIKLTVVIIVGYHCYQLHIKFYPTSCSQG